MLSTITKRQAFRLSLAGAGGFGIGAGISYFIGFGWTLIIALLAYIFVSVLMLGNETESN